MALNLSQWIQFENLEKREKSLEADLKVGEEFVLFEGHFPGNPVLPAVAILDISAFFLKNEVDAITPEKMVTSKSKFMEMIRPNQPIHLVAEESRPGTWGVRWYRADDKTLMAQVNLSV